MNDFMQRPAFLWRILLAAALLAVFVLTEAKAADCGCQAEVRHVCAYVAVPQRDSWVFAPSRYTHDPATGARVSQYKQLPAVEPLPDQRLVSSGYRRTRTVLRGADGSVDSTYQVQSYGNGRGGLDAEWERFHDAWRGSTIAGGNFYANGGFGFPGYGYPGYGMGQPGFVDPRFGGGRGRFIPPGQGYGPGHGRPDAGRLDPDGADGYRDPSPRTPDRAFFNSGLRSLRETPPAEAEE